MHCVETDDIDLMCAFCSHPLLLQTELAEMDTYENNATVNAMPPAVHFHLCLYLCL